MNRLRTCTTAAETEAMLTQMYGPGIAEGHGVVHVSAVWAEPVATGDPGPASSDLIDPADHGRTDPADETIRYRTIAINDASPPSDCDYFALESARARADAIITTGRNLREEPALSHHLQGPSASGLAAWRRDRVGKPHPPRVLILTSGRGLPMAHKALTGPNPVTLYTTEEAREQLASEAQLGPRVASGQLELAGTNTPSLQAAIAYLRAAHNCRTIVIEAGPSTARTLYQRPPDHGDKPIHGQVDELLLSVFHGPSLAARACGKEFVSPARIRALLPQRSSGFRCDQDGAPWRFWRYLRR